jgi:hypothetical protein
MRKTKSAERGGNPQSGAPETGAQIQTKASITAELEADDKMSGRIQIRGCYPPGIKIFQGKWILGTDLVGVHAQRRDATGGIWFSRLQYSVAVSKGGKIVVYRQDPDLRHEMGASFDIYETLADFCKSMDKEDARNVVEEVYHIFGGAKALPEEYLDL